MITVLVVDDQPLIRQAVTDILSHADGVDVVGEAIDGDDAIAAAAELHPDVVVMDIRMPHLDGIAATAAICADPELASTRVLILTTFEEDEYIVSALRAGASGFIGKGSEPEEIVHAVRAVSEGEALLSPVATRSLITKYVTPVARPAGAARVIPPELEQLTEREREVLLLVARGRSNQEIADELHISPHTAKTHVNRVMAKVYAHDRAQLVILAYESGLLAPDR
ncbi:DNA-binding response regulator, NarL/FixJ family, contains REC and HTH domains [Microbacterium sp. cf046]|uniref:response regulator transcription factor n=1 Tax=Microbacterium sp. cf046 TaxID=1761803 RepID=UPI0008E4AEDD|nr:response regulator transcription factor [Microbacterium sp. cf046]SFS17969.1 DNA-binding response regulator, NarL/FixJ family, contains REC and HTH domains [Microbacterium sp. cf046]